jgi:hypothetical protein
MLTRLPNLFLIEMRPLERYHFLILNLLSIDISCPNGRRVGTDVYLINSDRLSQKLALFLFADNRDVRT